MGNTATAFVILSSAVIVLTGLAALARTLLRIRDTLRDNTKATNDLTGELSIMHTSIDRRIIKLRKRQSRLEKELSGIRSLIGSKP